MQNNNLKSKLASYGAISGAFLAGGAHDVEAQVVYVDLPDQQFCVEAEVVNNLTAGGTQFASSTSENSLAINLNLANNPSSAISTGIGSIAPSQIRFKIEAGASDSSYTSSGTSYGSDDVWAAAVAYPIGNIQGGSIPSNLSLNQAVGPNSAFSGASIWDGLVNVARVEHLTSVSSSTFAYNSGNFGNGTTSHITEGYLGVRFNIGADTHFGWIRIEVEQHLVFESLHNQGGELSAKSCITILDYAYQSTPDTAIAVGDGAQAIPTLGQWGLIGLNLLLMIFGVVAVKRRNKIVIEQKVKG